MDKAEAAKTRPAVDAALGRIKGSLKEGTDIILGPRSYDEAKGTGSIKGENSDTTIEIVVTPKPDAAD